MATEDPDAKITKTIGRREHFGPPEFGEPALFPLIMRDTGPKHDDAGERYI